MYTILVEPENYIYSPARAQKVYKQSWIEAPKKQAIKFSVAACSDVSIVLVTKKVGDKYN